MGKRTITVIPPTDLPLTLDEAKVQLRLDPGFDDDDDLITNMISALTSQAQKITGRQFMQATLETWWDTWRDVDRSQYLGIPSDRIKIPCAPVIKVIDIQYFPSSGAELTVYDPSNYQIDNKSQNLPAQIRFVGELPDLADQLNAIRVQYLAGYGQQGDNGATQQDAIPGELKIWMQANLSTLYEHRQTFVDNRRTGDLNAYFADYLNTLKLWL
jgi:uncharacterized phiE125 gp8 family phage protein